MALEPRARARTIAGRGLEGNGRLGGKRQVTILALEAWQEACRELGTELSPALRRANLLVRGIELAESEGKVLSIGACRLLVRGETTPCARMDQVHPGLRRALEPQWRGGVYGELLDDGEIAVRDPVRWDGGGPR
jgi:MOSC domain-containing protein YiiM